MNHLYLSPAPATCGLRIALLVDRFGAEFGGAESYGVELARELSQRHHVTIIARDYVSDLDLPFIKVNASPRLPSWLRVLCFAWQASRLVKRRHFDIVHSHMNGATGDVQVLHVTPVRYKTLCSKSWTQKLAAWASPRKTAYLLLEKARVKRRPGRHVVAVSPRIRDEFHAAYGDLPCHTVLPGVRSDNLDTSQRNTTRQRLGLGEDTLVCLLIARNPLRKGLPALLRAMELLPKRYRLLVVGADPASLQTLLDSTSVGDRVCITGPTTQPSSYYAAADIYVHPTLEDAFGMAPLEAMAHGLPVIISNRQYCGFAEELSDGTNALVLDDPLDSREIAQAILDAGEDADLRAHLTAGARAIVRAHSWPDIASHYEAMYAQLLQQKQIAASNADLLL